MLSISELHWSRFTPFYFFTCANKWWRYFGHCMVSPYRTYLMAFIAWWISRRGDVCSPRLRCSSTCCALIIGLLATKRSLLLVRRSGTVCHTTLLTVCHWHNSAGKWKLFCFLYHFHDCFFLISGPWGFYLGHFKNFVCMYVIIRRQQYGPLQPCVVLVILSVCLFVTLCKNGQTDQGPLGMETLGNPRHIELDEGSTVKWRVVGECFPVVVKYRNVAAASIQCSHHRITLAICFLF